LPEPTLRAPVVVLTPVVGVTTPKVRGIGFRQVPKCRSCRIRHERHYAESRIMPTAHATLAT
jgi:hypothetical protein